MIVLSIDFKKANDLSDTKPDMELKDMITKINQMETLERFFPEIRP